MQRFTVHTGVPMPLKQTNVDTDQITPSRFMKRISRTGFQDALFADLRGKEGFPLDDPQFSGATILVAGADFGTGSSREHAVWSLMDHGFRVVISPRFGDIFRGNCGKSGLLAARVAQADVEDLWRAMERNPKLELTTDLSVQHITYDGREYTFEVASDVKHRLLEGLDDIDVTEQTRADIESFERRRPNFLPSVL